MTASVKTPLNIVMQKTPALTSVQVAQTSKPTTKTPTLLRPKMSRADELGACWTKQPASGGEEYMTGDVTIGGVKTSIVLFRNGFKDTDSKPDWRIYRRQSPEGVNVTQAVSQSETVEQDPGMLS